jgi:hypothetical protein
VGTSSQIKSLIEETMVSPATKRKARTLPWSPLDQWDVERHTNLAAERKKAKGLEVKIQKYSERKLVKKGNTTTQELSHCRKNTSGHREKRRKRVEMSISGRKLNLYLDSFELPMHVDDLVQSSLTEKGLPATYPSAFRVRGLPLVHFVPILIAIKDPAKRGMFTVTRGISGTNTDQYYLKNQDSTLPKGEAVFLDWRKSNLLDRTSVCAIDSLAWSILEALPDVANPSDWSIEVGFLCNRKDNGEVHQTLHLDVPEAEHFGQTDILPYIVHIPLCSEGMALQVVGANGQENPPNFRHYSFGEAAVLRADCWHGGCYGSRGNIRLRIYLTHKDFPGNQVVENLLHKRCNLPDSSQWPTASSILKFSQQSDTQTGRTLRQNWYRNLLVATMKGQEFLSLDLLSTVT